MRRPADCRHCTPSSAPRPPSTARHSKHQIYRHAFMSGPSASQGELNGAVEDCARAVELDQESAEARLAHANARLDRAASQPADREANLDLAAREGEEAPTTS